MKIFLDTNIVMEYFSERKNFENVYTILKAAKVKSLDAVVSTFTVDTLVYLMGIALKEKGMHEPEKRKEIRAWLNAFFEYVDMTDISRESALNGLNDIHFNDIEDGLQYYCALENDCDCLITINGKHFKNADKGLEVLDPAEFVNKYILLED